VAFPDRPVCVYIDRAPNAAGPGLMADDVDQCGWIVIGHPHFDHLWGADRIMARTGARLIGSSRTAHITPDPEDT
jgi:glyoxylase-like metal-dependent hydrolase (beta-lactamase superfamily II)